MNGKEIIQTKYFKATVVTVGGLFVVLVSFAGGVAVGLHKAKFSYAWGENYERNFLGGSEEREGKRARSFFGKMDMKGMRNGHGVAGEILSVSGDTLIIKNRENQETSVRVNDGTVMNQGKNALALSDLRGGEQVVVVGKPQDDGVIVAHLIRVFSGINTR